MAKVAKNFDELATRTFGYSLNFTGLMLALTGLPGAVLGIGIELASFLVHFAVDAKIKRRLKQHYVLKNQKPEYADLLKQLRNKNHVVVANYYCKGKPVSVIVATKDEVRLTQLSKQRLAITIDEALQEADKGQVIFSGGPQ